MVERVAPLAPEDYFGALVPSGSHLWSLELVRREAADAAAIDSNVLALHPQSRALRVLETWGPFPIQPAVIRTALPAEEKARISNALLTLHERHATALAAFGIARFVTGSEADYR